MARQLMSFGDALVAGVAVNDFLFSMQQLSDGSEVVHVGSRDHH
jgi:hypothetical protein